MIKKIIIGLAMVAFLSTGAIAQDSTSTSTSNSNAGASTSANNISGVDIGNVSSQANAISAPETTSNAVASPEINTAFEQGLTIEGDLGSIKDSFNSKSQRGFVIPGDVVFPGTPGYFGEATPGHRFIPLTKLLMYNTSWNVEDAKSMLSGNTGRKEVNIRALVKGEVTPTETINCSIEKPEGTVRQIAIGTVAAANGKAISADVFAKILVEASNLGANYIHFMAEGVNREVVAQGVGIGINSTQAKISDGGGSSNVTTGGLGWSKGWAGYVDMPWLQFTLLTVN